MTDEWQAEIVNQLNGSRHREMPIVALEGVSGSC